MEKKFNLQYDGQQVLQSDLNTLGESAGLADDRVLATLLQMAPGDGTTVLKGIIPSSPGSLISPAGATGSVTVAPFRAVIGSRTSPTVDGRKSLRDIRSALSTPDGIGPLLAPIVLAPNASGNPRWDLVYAIVTLDAPSTAETRKVKDPASSVVSSLSVTTQLINTCTVASRAGTPAVAPVWPAVPADTASTYYIVLGYVVVATGFTGASTVALRSIATMAQVLRPAPQTGVNTTSVSTAQYTPTTSQQGTWGQYGGADSRWVPPTMTGSETLWVMLDLRDPSIANHSHQSNGVIDSRDWRGRIVTTIASFGGPASTEPSWGQTIAVPGNVFPHGGYTRSGFSSADARTCTVVANTMVADGFLAVGLSTLAYFSNTQTTQIAAATTVAVYCDMATGALKLFYSGIPGCLAILRIDLSGVYANRP